MIRIEVKVSRKIYLTPHYIRVFLTGKDIHLVENTTIGVNNKILIPQKGQNKVYFPEFDYEKMKWKPQPKEQQSIIRTYTHRGIDLKSNEIWIDFVAHGEEGPASAWAINAKEGDLLGILMKDGKSELYAPADHYFLVGDATAIPVLGAILESLPSTSKAYCLIEVHGKEDEQIIASQAEVEWHWLHNKEPQKGSLLSSEFKKVSLPDASRFAYVAAESTTVKAIRKYLRQEKQWLREEFYAYSYWKSGESEEKSTEERRQEAYNSK